MKTIIIGGVAGGASAAARLRRNDENAEIVLFEKGPFISFANCGLPYYIGGSIKEKASLTLQTPESFNKRFNVIVKINSEIIKINPSEKSVTVKNTLTNETYNETYDNLILSPGASPVKPPIKGIESDKVFTLRNIPDVLKIKSYIEDKKPNNAIVVGGGFIGLEMAENLVETGLKVTLIELAENILPPMDSEMTYDIAKHLKAKGVNLVLGDGVNEIADDGTKLEVSTAKGSKISSDMIILSIGVKPDTDFIKDSGINLSERGSILVNESLMTNIPNVYAVGDAILVKNFVTKADSFIPLAGPANKQGRMVADNICGKNKSYNGTQGSSIIKIFDLTVATTGINEKTAKALNYDYDKIFLAPMSHAGYYPGGKEILMKVIFEKTSGKILGAQAVGEEGVDKRCDVLATVIRFGGTAHDLSELELCYAPPYSSAKDPVNMAGFMIENILDGSIKNYHYSDIKNLPRDGSVTLLDVRTPYEYEAGHIDGYINIQLDELRNRISELDNTKPIYVHCLSGMRSYVACKILASKGFDCYNLSGGYRLYSSTI